MVSLGALRRLFWDPRATLHLEPLHTANAIDLFEMAVRELGLRDEAVIHYVAAQGEPMAPLIALR